MSDTFEPERRSAPASAVGGWTVEPRTGALEWDDACAGLHGALPGETPAQTRDRVLHTADRDRLPDPSTWTLDTVHTYRTTSPDGPQRYLLQRVTAVTGDPTRDGWLSGITLDVTAARQLHVQASVALQWMTDGFLAVDEEFRFTYLNDAAEHHLRRPAAELLGRTIWEAFPTTASGIVREAYERVMATGEPQSIESEASGGRWFQTTIHRAPEGLFNYFRDCTTEHAAAVEQQRLVRELEVQASTDALTGLDNSTQLRRRLAGHLRSASSARAVVMFLDLDRFKLVNDTMGHSAGDELLREVARRLRRVAGPRAVVSRTGGDEFIVALTDVSDADAEEVARRILAAVSARVLLLGRPLHVSTSIGIASGGHSVAAETLLRNADMALYRAKDAGRDTLAWYDQGMHDALLHRSGLEKDLRQAVVEATSGSVADQELRLHFQPSFSLSTGLPTGAEALLRWLHPRRGMVSPGEAIPVAEESGLILPLGDWVLQAAADQAVAWRDVPDFTVWCNVAPQQLASRDIPGQLMDVLAKTGLAPHRLGIEVTESAFAEQFPATAALTEVRRLGVKVAIDDFGTGYSSLSRLLTLPVDVVKIDRSFVQAGGTVAGRAVLAGIVELAHGLGASVIAEGVETHAELDVLRGTSCDDVSGFLLARPLPADQQPLGRVRLSAPRQGGVPTQPSRSSQHADLH